MGKRIFIILICISISLIILSLVFIYSEKGTETINDEYKVTILSNGLNETYVVYVPIVINKNDEVAKIMENLKIIDGNGNFEIIETEYGKTLKIEGNQNLSLIAKYGKTKNYVDHPGSAYREKYYCWGLGLSMYDNVSVPDFIEIDQRTAKIADLWIYVELQNHYFNNNSINITLELNRDHLYERETSSGGKVVDKINIITSKQGWQQVDLFRTPVAYK
jgi:hypothetical protein